MLIADYLKLMILGDFKKGLWMEVIGPVEYIEERKIKDHLMGENLLSMLQM